MLPTISARVGLDRAPVDLQDPDQSRWQLACVWPDTGRLARTRLALDEARRESLTIVQGDAVDRVAELIDRLPGDATAVVTTTWVVAYFSGEHRAGFREALAAASTTRPVAWISAETPGRRRPDPERRRAFGSERRRVERARPRPLPGRRTGSRAARLRPPARQRTRLAAPVALRNVLPLATRTTRTVGVAARRKGSTSPARLSDRGCRARRTRSPIR